jgi:hypothetical protein
MDGASVLATLPLAPSGTTTSSAAFASSSFSPGTHILSAVYNGSGDFAPSSATLTETIIGISPTTTTLSGSPNPSYFGNTVSFLVTVASALPGAGPPTGAVTLTLGGTTLLGTQTLAPAGTSTSQASFSINNLPLGGQAILASYNATGNFLGSIAAITETVLPPPDFFIALASPSITIRTQHHLTTTLTLTSLNGFADSIALGCVNPPTYVTCVFTPQSATLAANATTTVSLYLDTDSVLGYARLHSTPSPTSASPSPINLALLLSPFGIFLALARHRRSPTRLCLLVLLLAAIPASAALTGCGELIYPYAVPPSATPGTYSIEIVASGATTGITHTTQLTLTVTP